MSKQSVPLKQKRNRTQVVTGAGTGTLPDLASNKQVNSNIVATATPSGVGLTLSRTSSMGSMTFKDMNNIIPTTINTQSDANTVTSGLSMDSPLHSIRSKTNSFLRTTSSSGVIDAPASLISSIPTPNPFWVPPEDPKNKRKTHDELGKKIKHVEEVLTVEERLARMTLSTSGMRDWWKMMEQQKEEQQKEELSRKQKLRSR